MAAAAAAINNYMQNTLNIPQNVANEVVNTHGYTSFSDFAQATEDQIHDLIIAIRNTPSDVNNPNSNKIVVGQQFALRLSFLAHYSRYIETIQRNHTDNLGSVVNVTKIGRFFTHHKNHTDADLPDYPAAYDNKNSRVMLEDIDSWLSKAYGQNEIILSYITRDYPKPADDPVADPGFLRPSIESELIRRAKHDDDNYEENNKKVWSMIRAVTHKTDAWAIVKAFSRTGNGRGAYLALVAQYKGRGHVNRIKTEARNVLDRIFWNGKSRNFSWDTFTSRLQGAFDDLEEHGDNRTDEHRVTTLLEKVEKDGGLNAACTYIRNDATLSHDFRKALEYLTGEVLALDRLRTRARDSRSISTVSTSTNSSPGRGRGRGRGGRTGRGQGRGNGGGRGHYHNRNNRGFRPGQNNPIGTSDRFSSNGQILLNDGAYSNDVWWNVLSADERAYCENLRRKRREQVRNNNTRTTSSLESTPQNNDASNNTSQENRDNNAGSQMSRRRNGQNN